MLMNLADKVVLITGASTGLGKAIASRLSQEKAKMVLNARNAEKLQEITRDIASQGGICSCFACDVTDMNQTKNVVEYVMEAYGRIDILINNAGIWYEGPTENHPKEKIAEMFRVNSLGVIYTIQEILPIMKKQHYGQIFNVISNAGVEPAADWGVYTATKYAVRGFTDSLKLELVGTGVKVSGFYPGGTNTDLFDSSGFPKGNASWMMDKNDVAEIVAFILKQPEDIAMDHTEIHKFIG